MSVGSGNPEPKGLPGSGPTSLCPQLQLHLLGHLRSPVGSKAKHEKLHKWSPPSCWEGSPGLTGVAACQCAESQR